MPTQPPSWKSGASLVAATVAVQLLALSGAAGLTRLFPSKSSPVPIAESQPPAEIETPTAEALFAGEWTARTEDGITAAVTFAADGSGSAAVTSAGTNADLAVYRHAGLVVRGTYRFRAADVVELTAKKLEFKNLRKSVDVQALTDPPDPAGFVTECQVRVVHADLMILTCADLDRTVELRRMKR
jgi:hypothetical protein